MSEHPIQGMMDTTMEKIRKMVDVNTIIGDPIVAAPGITIIPISKVSYGFASGGSDLPAKNNPKDLFGGGAGAGVSIQPVGFLVVQDGDVKLLQMSEGDDTISNVIRAVPDVVDKKENQARKNQKHNCIKSIHSHILVL